MKRRVRSFHLTQRGAEGQISKLPLGMPSLIQQLRIMNLLLLTVMMEMLRILSLLHLTPLLLSLNPLLMKLLRMLAPVPLPMPELVGIRANRLACACIEEHVAGDVCLITCAHTHAHTISLSLSLSHTHTHSHTQTQTHIRTSTHARMHVHAHTHTHTHTITHTHAHTQGQGGVDMPKALWLRTTTAARTWRTGSLSFAVLPRPLLLAITAVVKHRSRNYKLLLTSHLIIPSHKCAVSRLTCRYEGTHIPTNTHTHTHTHTNTHTHTHAHTHTRTHAHTHTQTHTHTHTQARKPAHTHTHTYTHMRLRYTMHNLFSPLVFPAP